MKELGDGTCGTVYKAINMRTSEIVAVKKMKRKFYDWVECINLREVKSLCKLNHPNIIKLKEIVRENNELFFIFEYMEHNLYQTMKERQRPLSEEEIRGLLSQLLQGLAHIHRNGYFHRDLKPDWNAFPEARNISRLIDISYLHIMPVNLSDMIPNASLEAIDLIEQLCSWDPLRRPTADQCLQHPFFHAGTWIPHSLGDPLQLKLSNDGSKPNLELNLWDFGMERDDCFLGLTLAVNPSSSSQELVIKNEQDMLLCSGFQDHSQQSVVWSLLPSDQHRISAPMESSLSLSFSSIPHTSAGVPQSAGFAVASLQTNIFDRPLLAMSSPFQQGHYL
nr:Serine/threonine-protein kinase MHK [Ipomoea batatas]